MAITMNDKSMNEELDKLLQENEKDISRTWATMASSTPKLHTYAIHDGSASKIGFNNIYCYIGLSEINIKIVTLHALDVTRVTGTFLIPLQDICHIAIKNGIIKCSAMLDFGNERIKLAWVNGAVGTDIKDQRKQIKRLYDFLSTRSH